MEKDIYQLELFIAKFLRYGVVLAGILMLVGWLTQIDFAVDAFEPFRVYHDAPLFQTLTAYWEAGRWGLITAYAGMFVLISLPLFRVLMTLVVFMKKHDYALAAVSALVLLGLALSLALGFKV